MIWKLPWAMTVAALHVALLVSWLLLPEAWHRAVWSRDLCRWAMHDDEYTVGLAGMKRKCRRCGRQRFTPATP